MKNYIYIVSGILFITLIVGIVSVERAGNYYKLTPEDVHQLSLKAAMFIDSSAIINTNEELLMICLEENSTADLFLSEKVKSITIDPTLLLEKENRRILKNTKNAIVLKSTNAEIAANTWVILSRLGYTNIKIWKEKAEDLDHSLVIDTLAN